MTRPRTALVTGTRAACIASIILLFTGVTDQTWAVDPVNPGPVIGEARRAASDGELQRWIENMVVHHRFTIEEVAAATGLWPNEAKTAIDRFDLAGKQPQPRGEGDPLRVLPYPGGRHPRIGFLDGAVRPQRETKVSVFTPWDDASYIVVDVPEAIWSNLGLTYLAHTHIDTVWTKRSVELAKREWRLPPDGSLWMRRQLPNGIVLEAAVLPTAEVVWMSIELTNGTAEPLSDLRVQNCVMLRGAAGMDEQVRENKVARGSLIAARNEAGDQWVVTGWEPLHRTWDNPPVPCIHSDPKFPDAGPGQTVRVRGFVSFHEGREIEGEFDRLEAAKVLGEGWGAGWEPLWKEPERVKEAE